MPQRALDALWEKLDRASLKNSESKYFLPDSKLYAIFADADTRLEQCLQEGGIEPVDHEEVLSTVRNGGQKIFTVLVLMKDQPVRLILNFMHGDQGLDTQIDARLPFSMGDLTGVLEDSHLATQFDRRQWEVLSPLFKADRMHRELKHQTILPFILESEVKNGGGIVSKVTLHETHHRFALNFGATSEVVMARKRISLSDSSEHTFHNEKRVMRLLRLLRHEHMVQILATYSLFDSEGVPTHYLLMPLADMRLTTLLKPPDHGLPIVLDEVFGNQVNLLREIHGLSSALENLHFYEFADKDLHFKGCHFDLDPRNILIQKGKLLLADFGLSKLKRDSSNSCTPVHGGGASQYTAPECLSDELPQYHGGKSDIWSFGGILCDITACMMGGVRAAVDFQTSRKHTTDGITSSRFHRDGRLNPAVEIWVSKQKPNMVDDHLALYHLSIGMMTIDPKLRPNSHMVTDQLFMIAIKSHYREFAVSLQNLVDGSKSLRLQLEQINYTVWARHACLLESDPAKPSMSESWLTGYSKTHVFVKSLLKKIHDEVNLFHDAKIEGLPSLPVLDLLQEVCEKLWSLAPSTVRSAMTREVETEILNLSTINMTMERLQPILNGCDEEAYTERESQLLQFAAIRKFAQFLVDQEDVPSYHFDARCFEESQLEIKDFQHRHRKKKSGQRERSLVLLKGRADPYLCEWIYYDARIVDIEPERLHRRVCSLVRQLSVVGAQSDLRALNCEGYFASIKNSAYGILFSFPTRYNHHIEPISLNQILRSCARPSLTDVLNTAKAIAKSIFFFHGIHWVHKSISSHAVIFFDEGLWKQFESVQIPTTTSSATELAKDESRKEEIKQSSRGWFGKKSTLTSTSNATQKSNVRKELSVPKEQNEKTQFKLDHLPQHYIVGFNHSRVDDKLTFTRGDAGLWYEYQHYRYAHQSGQMFQSGYDYYSLGLVLLELAFWKPLERLPVFEKRLSEYHLDELYDIVCNKAVPLLRPLVGEAYLEAVRTCLSGDLLDRERSQVEATFNMEVLARLESCHV